MTAGEWLELQIEVQLSLQEEVGLFLTDFSGRGVVLEDFAASGAAGLVGVKAYFPAGDFDGARQQELQRYLERLRELSYQVGPLQLRSIREEDWAHNWQAHFTPIKLTRRLVIRPPWGEYEAQADELVLIVYPGMAFGTGRHPSTSLCLQALEDLGETLAVFGDDCQALDVGTGTGILALAAARLGAKVLAIDIDPEAVAAARENILLNRLQEVIRAEDLPLTAIRQRFDLIMANLTMADLASLAESLAGRLLPRGRLIISGFLQDDLEHLLERFVAQGLQRLQHYLRDDWVAVTLYRP